MVALDFTLLLHEHAGHHSSKLCPLLVEYKFDESALGRHLHGCLCKWAISSMQQTQLRGTNDQRVGVDPQCSAQ